MQNESEKKGGVPLFPSGGGGPRSLESEKTERNALDPGGAGGKEGGRGGGGGALGGEKNQTGLYSEKKQKAKPTKKGVGGPDTPEGEKKGTGQDRGRNLDEIRSSENGAQQLLNLKTGGRGEESPDKRRKFLTSNCGGVIAIEEGKAKGVLNQKKKKKKAVRQACGKGKTKAPNLKESECGGEGVRNLNVQKVKVWEETNVHGEKKRREAETEKNQVTAKAAQNEF